ncbi:sugar ABC transporter permease [Streptomyces enissocaesilis]|uniref:Sugar ABC transporter permease n=1 Tax=Streptomyces enissocaesilis TaxID=332589 RepID=A0ABN3XN88_9ACTN
MPKTSRLRPRRLADWGWGLAFVGPQLVGLLVFVLGPLIFAMVLSLMEWNAGGTQRFVGLENFEGQFRSEEFWAALRNTGYFTLLVVPGDLVCSLLVALALNNVRGRVVYRLLFFMPVVASSVAVSVVWLWLLNGEFGPLNSYLRDWFGIDPPNWLVDPDWVIPAIVLVSLWRGIGFTMVIFLAGLQSIPAMLTEAAEIDGASSLQRFWHVTLPMLSPTILFLAVTSIIGSFQVFDLAYVMTQGGPGNASRTLVFHVYDLAFVGFDFGASAAAGAVLFVILLVLTLAQLWAQRRWVHYDE